MNPWREVGKLSAAEVDCLSQKTPELAQRACLLGATADEEDRTRLKLEPELVYQLGREQGTRHLVFRRTNLPCLRCGEIVRQLRQPTANAGEEERSRIMYFCPGCQNVKLPEKRRKAIRSNAK